MQILTQKSLSWTSATALLNITGNRAFVEFNSDYVYYAVNDSNDCKCYKYQISTDTQTLIGTISSGLNTPTFQNVVVREFDGVIYFLVVWLDLAANPGDDFEAEACKYTHATSTWAAIGNDALDSGADVDYRQGQAIDIIYLDSTVIFIYCWKDDGTGNGGSVRTKDGSWTTLDTDTTITYRLDTQAYCPGWYANTNLYYVGRFSNNLGTYDNLAFLKIESDGTITQYGGPNLPVETTDTIDIHSMFVYKQDPTLDYDEYKGLIAVYQGHVFMYEAEGWRNVASSSDHENVPLWEKSGETYIIQQFVFDDAMYFLHPQTVSPQCELVEASYYGGSAHYIISSSTIYQWTPGSTKDGTTVELINLNFNEVRASFLELEAADVWTQDQLISVYNDSTTLYFRYIVLTSNKITRKVTLGSPLLLDLNAFITLVSATNLDVVLNNNLKYLTFSVSPTISIPICTNKPLYRILLESVIYGGYVWYVTSDLVLTINDGTILVANNSGNDIENYVTKVLPSYIPISVGSVTVIYHGGESVTVDRDGIGGARAIYNFPSIANSTDATTKATQLLTDTNKTILRLTVEVDGLGPFQKGKSVKLTWTPDSDLESALLAEGTYFIIDSSYDEETDKAKLTLQDSRLIEPEILTPEIVNEKVQNIIDNGILNQLTLGGHSVDDLDITSEASDADDHLMTALAIKNRITDYTTGALSPSSLTLGGHAVDDLDITSEASDADDHLMTALAIYNRILDLLPNKVFGRYSEENQGSTKGWLSGDNWNNGGIYFPASDNDCRGLWQFAIPNYASGNFVLHVIYWCDGSRTYSGKHSIIAYAVGETLAANNILDQSTAYDLVTVNSKQLYDMELPGTGIAAGDLVSYVFQSDASNARFVVIREVWIEWDYA